MIARAHDQSQQQGAVVSVTTLCLAHGVSRQSHYAWRKRQEQGEQRAEVLAEVLAEVRAWRRQHPRLGTRKLYHCLKAAWQQRGIKLGRDGLFGLLRETGLLIKRRRRQVTTNSRHRFSCYDNLVADYQATAAHQLLVSDITYLRTADGFVYLALTTDAYSRKIVGYDLSSSLETAGSLRALRQALAQLPACQGVIHHSDRGTQYCSHAYTGLLKQQGLRISMTTGSVYENALAERVNGILKLEYGLDATFSSYAQALRAVKQAIYLYNQERPHLALNYRTPAEVHQQWQALAA